VEKNLSDHTEFVKAKEEFDTWLKRAHGTVQDCIGVGDEASTRDKLETIRVSMENLVLFCPCCYVIAK
jgi:nesprin-1